VKYLRLARQAVCRGASHPVDYDRLISTRALWCRREVWFVTCTPVVPPQILSLRGWWKRTDLQVKLLQSVTAFPAGRSDVVGVRLGYPSVRTSALGRVNVD
jgi:hypothetical protein